MQFNTHEAVKALLVAQKRGKEDFVEEVVNQLQQSRETDFSKLATKADLEFLRKDLEMVQFELTKKIDDNRIDAQNGLDKLESRVNGRIDNLESQVNAKIEKLGSQVNGRIDNLESRFDTKLSEQKNSLIQWMVGLQLTTFGLIVALKLFG